MAIIRAIRRARREHWGDSLYWLIFPTVFGGLLPLWGSWLLLRLLGVTFSLLTFVENGELLVFTASILSAAFYTITRQPSLTARLLLRHAPSFGEKRFPGQQLFSWLIVGLILVSALMFAAVLASGVARATLRLDVSFLQPLSLIVSGLALVLCFLVTLIDNSWTETMSVRKDFRRPLDELSRQFDQIEGE